MSPEKRKRDQESSGHGVGTKDDSREENDAKFTKKVIQKKDRIETKQIVARACKHGWPNKVVEDADHVCGEARFWIKYRRSFNREQNGKRGGSSSLLHWMMDLTEMNMKALYLQTWGWNEKQKLRELR